MSGASRQVMAMSLADLPSDHPLRNNELSPLWTDDVDWRAKAEDQEECPPKS